MKEIGQNLNKKTYNLTTLIKIGLTYILQIQSNKLLKRAYHCRSMYMYRFVKARIKLVKNAKLTCLPSISNPFFLNWLFSWLIVGQINFFTKLERRLKQRNWPFKKIFHHLKRKLAFLNLKHYRERRRVNNFQTRFFVYLKENS